MDKPEFEAWEDRVAARARVLWAEAGGLEGGPEGGPETRAGDAGLTGRIPRRNPRQSLASRAHAG